jgi:hypothetical protein
MARQSVILFGEGLTEAIFLNHLKNEFQVHQRMRVKVDKGRGYMIKLRDQCPQLFPVDLLESKRSSISELDELLDFLQV